MRVVFNLGRYHTIEEPVTLALGTFDGMHKGHQKLLEQLKQMHKLHGHSTMVYTFLEHPLNKLEPNKAPSQIMSLAQKMQFLNRHGINWLILNTFDIDFAQTSPQSFITDLLLGHYNVRSIVVGYNYKFGFGGKGNIDFLRKMSLKYGFELIVVPPVTMNGKVVSSSLIRQLIGEGEVEAASQYLGYPYAIGGQVIHGFGRGKKIGFPTANLSFNPRKVIPKYGVYVTRAWIQGQGYWGVTNVGQNPTFENNGLFLETHLMDFNYDIYGERLKIEFLARVRDEKKFSNIQDLQQQIDKDVHWAKNFVYKYIGV